MPAIAIVLGFPVPNAADPDGGRMVTAWKVTVCAGVLLSALLMAFRTMVPVPVAVLAAVQLKLNVEVDANERLAVPFRFALANCCG